MIQAKVNYMYCNNCGAYVYDGELTCPECGAPTNQTQYFTQRSYVESAEPRDLNYPALFGFILSILGTALIIPFSIISAVYAIKADKETSWDNYYQAMATTVAPIQIVFGIIAAIIVTAGLVLSIVGYLQTKYSSSLEFKFSLTGLIIASVSIALLFVMYLVVVTRVI